MVAHNRSSVASRYVYSPEAFSIGANTGVASPPSGTMIQRSIVFLGYFCFLPKTGGGHSQRHTRHRCRSDSSPSPVPPHESLLVRVGLDILYLRIVFHWFLPINYLK